MSKYRILSMDGSSITGGNGFVTAGILKGMKSHLKNADPEATLLNDVFLFCGSSAGAFNALFLARWDDPDCALDHILEFWQQVMDNNSPEASTSVLRVLTSLTGQTAFLSTEKLRGFFESYFGNLRLGDLKKKVLISSFQLDNGKPEARRWKPKIFNNFHNDPDCDLKVSDVAMRSGSPPLITPIYQGFVDGGVVANNPTMLGVAQVLHEVQPVPGDLDPLRKLLVLSIGNAAVPQYLDPVLQDGIADWGYSDWLFDIRQPLILVQMLLDGGVLAVHYESKRLLGKDYFRSNPMLAKPLGVTNGSQVLEAVAKFMRDPVTQAELRASSEWFQRIGWVPPKEAAAPPPHEGEPEEASGGKHTGSGHGKRKHS